jgi:CheY-like chemotaxis protein
MVILMADDSEDDRLMTRDALKESAVQNDVREVEDGEELMDYLLHRGAYSEPGSSPRPGLILLDLNMPRKSGMEALKEIKSDHELRRIPVVVLTTSQDEDDLMRSYDLGGNSYISKPGTFGGLLVTIRSFARYWIDTVSTPSL